MPVKRSRDIIVIEYSNMPKLTETVTKPTTLKHVIKCTRELYLINITVHWTELTLCLKTI